MARKEKLLKETKVLLLPKEDTILQKMADEAGQSKTKFCSSEIRKLIKQRNAKY